MLHDDYIDAIRYAMSNCPIKKLPWHIKFRQWLAKLIVRLASLIYKESPEIKKFKQQMTWDAAIHGQSIIKIDPIKPYNFHS